MAIFKVVFVKGEAFLFKLVQKRRQKYFVLNAVELLEFVNFVRKPPSILFHPQSLFSTEFLEKVLFRGVKVEALPFKISPGRGLYDCFSQSYNSSKFENILTAKQLSVYFKETRKIMVLRGGQSVQ